eukprot:4810324-Amphidinium_carterae.1
MEHHLEQCVRRRVRHNEGYDHFKYSQLYSVPFDAHMVVACIVPAFIYATLQQKPQMYARLALHFDDAHTDRQDIELPA